MRYSSLLLLLCFFACQSPANENVETGSKNPFLITYAKTGDIAPPKGYTRLPAPGGSFSQWLRQLSLKKDKIVYLYNGERKRNQFAQFAVLDISTGNRDLQQCADAVMRLRAEYLFAEKRFDEIRFTDNAGKEYQWKGGDDRKRFDSYLNEVFGWCGSASLSKQLKTVSEGHEVVPGDVLIQGGFPGHAMLVMDVAVNAEGKRMLLLAQSYMPAQDIHIVVNPMDNKSSPWYEWKPGKILTPEWKFHSSDLKSW